MLIEDRLKHSLGVTRQCQELRLSNMDIKTDKALLIIDVQKGFINENTEHIPALVEKLQEDYDCIFATKFINKENSLYRSLLAWDECSRNSQEAELAFTPTNNCMVLQKTAYGCPKILLEYIHIFSIKEIHLVGIDTDACVYKCALDLFDTGIVPVVLKDYCASSAGKDIHDTALRILARNIGKNQIR